MEKEKGEGWLGRVRIERRRERKKGSAVSMKIIDDNYKSNKERFLRNHDKTK
jgi:hypothetical protein